MDHCLSLLAAFCLSLILSGTHSEFVVKKGIAKDRGLSGSIYVILARDGSSGTIRCPVTEMGDEATANIIAMNKALSTYETYTDDDGTVRCDKTMPRHPDDIIAKCHGKKDSCEVTVRDLSTDDDCSKRRVRLYFYCVSQPPVTSAPSEVPTNSTTGLPDGLMDSLAALQNDLSAIKKDLASIKQQQATCGGSGRTTPYPLGETTVATATLTTTSATATTATTCPSATVLATINPALDGCLIANTVTPAPTPAVIIAKYRLDCTSTSIARTVKFTPNSCLQSACLIMCQNTQNCASATVDIKNGTCQLIRADQAECRYLPDDSWAVLAATSRYPFAEQKNYLSYSYDLKWSYPAQMNDPCTGSQTPTSRLRDFDSRSDCDAFCRPACTAHPGCNAYQCRFAASQYGCELKGLPSYGPRSTYTRDQTGPSYAMVWGGNDK